MNISLSLGHEFPNPQESAVQGKKMFLGWGNRRQRLRRGRSSPVAVVESGKFRGVFFGRGGEGVFIGGMRVSRGFLRGVLWCVCGECVVAGAVKRGDFLAAENAQNSEIYF